MVFLYSEHPPSNQYSPPKQNNCAFVSFCACPCLVADRRILRFTVNTGYSIRAPPTRNLKIHNISNFKTGGCGYERSAHLLHSLCCSERDEPQERTHGFRVFRTPTLRRTPQRRPRQAEVIMILAFSHRSSVEAVTEYCIKNIQSGGANSVSKNQMEWLRQMKGCKVLRRSGREI